LIVIIQGIEFNTIFCTETTVLSMLSCQAAKFVQGEQAILSNNVFLQPDARGWSVFEASRERFSRRRFIKSKRRG
jgi:hypothetical protein